MPEIDLRAASTHVHIHILRALCPESVRKHYRYSSSIWAAPCSVQDSMKEGFASEKPVVVCPNNVDPRHFAPGYERSLRKQFYNRVHKYCECKCPCFNQWGRSLPNLSRFSYGALGRAVTGRLTWHLKGIPENQFQSVSSLLSAVVSQTHWPMSKMIRIQLCALSLICFSPPLLGTKRWFSTRKS